MATTNLSITDSAKILTLSQTLVNTFKCGNSTQNCIQQLKSSITDVQSLVAGVQGGNADAIKSSISDLGTILGQNSILGDDVIKIKDCLIDIVSNVSAIVTAVTPIHFNQAISDLEKGDIGGLLTDVKDINVTAIVTDVKNTFSTLTALKDDLVDAFDKIEAFVQKEIAPTLHSIKVEITHTQIAMEFKAWEKNSTLGQKVHKFFKNIETKLDSIFGLHKINATNTTIIPNDIDHNDATTHSNLTMHDNSPELHINTPLMNVTEG